MEPLKIGVLINKNAKVREGICKGLEGTVIGYDFQFSEVSIRLDELTVIVTSPNNIEQ
jgi:hypothetical protein